MKTIEERAYDYAKVTTWDDIDGYPSDIYATNAYNAYVEGAKEQKAIDKEAMLKGFTTDELRAELKIRNAEERAERESVLRCRMCRHWGAIDYWGNPLNSDFRDKRSCVFFKTKNGKNYRCHNASQLACEHFERKEG